MKLIVDIDDKTYETIKNAEPLKWDCPIESAYNAIKNGIPQKTGHWIDAESLDSALWYACSECGETEYYATNYCPNCGAKMEVEE